MTATSIVLLRPPTFSTASQPSSFTSPSIAWLKGIWHVTHSTLPMWKTKSDVTITYTPLPPSSPSLSLAETDRLDDLVEYRNAGSDKVQTIHGIDTCASTDGGRGEWNWRGKGWLKVASSYWEVLAWGDEGEGRGKWAVTMFAKTVFTPAGLDVYSGDASGVRADTLTAIKKALAEVEDESVRKLASEMFEIDVDGGRNAANLE